MAFPAIKSAALWWLLSLVLGMSGDKAAAKVTATLGSKTAVVSESVLLTVKLTGLQLVGPINEPKVSPLTMVREGERSVNIGGKIEYVSAYLISSVKPGVFRIPPFKIEARSGVHYTEELVLRVYEQEELDTFGLTLDKGVVPYLSGTFLEKKNPYVGETQQVEAKLYLATGQPNFLSIEEPQVIQIEKDGIAAWRFTASKSPTGYLEREGTVYGVFTYKSSASALREGNLKLGPGKVKPMVSLRKTRNGAFVRVVRPIEIEFKSREIEARPLPSDPPDGFAGAVGNFTVNVNPLSNDIELGEALTVELEVRGEGNLDQFPGPELDGSDEEWKKFEMTAKPQGAERRSSSGVVEFSQTLRPLAKVSGLPPYRFVFFDPVLEQYRTIFTPTIPLLVTGELPESGAPTAAENLEFLTASSKGLIQFSNPKKAWWADWKWQLVPALLFLIVLGLVIHERYLGWRIKTQPDREFAEELAGVKRTAQSRAKFYRAAADFAIRWKGKDEVAEIFDVRDDVCFRPEPVEEPVSPEEKKSVLARLSKLSPVVIGVLFFLQNSPAKALSNDPTVARTEILQQIETEPAREHFYNLALCEFELGNPGQAALWAHRFEAQGGEAEELLKKIPGADPLTPEGTEWVSVLPRSLYKNFLWAGCWAAGIAILGLFFRSPQKRRFVFRAAFSAAILLSAFGGTGFVLYPKEISFLPRHQLSVITVKSPLQSQPFEGGRNIRDNIEGSLCYVEATRDDWKYVVLPGGMKGWMSADSVTGIAL